MRKLYKPVLKLGLCLLFFGAIYYFAVVNTSGKDQPSDLSKLSALRSSLNESLIASSELSSFDESDAAAGNVLDRLVSRLESTLSDTEKAQKNAMQLLKPSQSEAIVEVIALQREAIKRLKSKGTSLSQLIIYNPETDLGKIDLSKDRQALNDRSQAASNGLQVAINKQSANTVDGLGVGSAGDDVALRLDEPTLALIKSSSECFSRLASSVDGPTAQSIRSECIKGYPAMRGQVLKSLLGGSFDGTYIKDLQAQMLPLLKDIDDTTSTLNS